MTPPSRDQQFLQGVLANAGLFAGVSPGGVAMVARHAGVIAALRGDALSRRGEPLPGVFVVGYGLVKLALRAPGSQERVLRIVSAGQSFGAAAALLGRVPRYEASALVDAKLVVVPSEAVLALMDRAPPFCRSVMRLLAERVLDLAAELEALSLHSGGRRLASYLGSLAEPVARNGGWAAQLPMSKTLIAARLGMKKETLSRLLRKLAAAGLIEVSRREITILDRDALARAWSPSSDRARSA